MNSILPDRVTENKFNCTFSFLLSLGAIQIIRDGVCVCTEQWRQMTQGAERV
jgi:hypothetical protein